LVALLTRLGAVDLAGQVWTVRDVRDLPPDVRAAIYDILGTAAAGGWREHELDELARVPSRPFPIDLRFRRGSLR